MIQSRKNLAQPSMFNAKKKLLVFVDWFPPAFLAGGPIRSITNLVDLIHDRYEIHIVTTNLDDDQRELKDTIKDHWVRWQDKVVVYYASRKKLNFKKIQQLISEVDASVVYINSFFSLRLSIMPLLILCRSPRPIVLAPRGELFHAALLQKYFRKKAYLLFFKHLIFHFLKKRLKFQATGAAEADAIRQRIHHDCIIDVVPNVPSEVSEVKHNLVKTPGLLRIVCVARIHPHKGQSFVIKSLRNLKGNIEVDFYGDSGKGGQEEMQKCANLIKDLPTNVKVNFKGPIKSDKIVEILPLYHLFYLPSRSENFGHSIVEALSSGVPLLISDSTPWKNLEQKKCGWDFALDQTIHFEQALQTMVNLNQDEFDKLKLNAINYGKEIIKSYRSNIGYERLFG